MANVKAPEEVVCIPNKFDFINPRWEDEWKEVETVWNRLGELPTTVLSETLRVPILRPLGLIPPLVEPAKPVGLGEFGENFRSANLVCHGDADMGIQDRTNEYTYVDRNMALQHFRNDQQTNKHRSVSKVLLFYPNSRKAVTHMQICHSFLRRLKKTAPDNSLTPHMEWYEGIGFPYNYDQFLPDKVKQYRDKPITAESIKDLLSCRAKDWQAYKRFIKFLVEDKLFGCAFMDKELDLPRALMNGLEVDTYEKQWLVMTSVVGLRHIREFPYRVLAWDEMVRQGVNPRVAFVLMEAVYLNSYAYTWKSMYMGHQHFEVESMTVEDISRIGLGLRPDHVLRKNDYPAFCGYQSFNDAWTRHGDELIHPHLNSIKKPVFKRRYKCGFSGKRKTKEYTGWQDIPTLVQSVLPLVKEYNWDA